ncbi:GNAT family N-acetyltransferase [Cohnella sp. REN36]|uniref:GNAT family N-acetyltransferase n=1 Tax=Cohnella sp. REN36 TaxID=2887347 RepID=UPI001D158EB7|nr:GNAT family N-acetyltransferase [Cohnella sp. REN36]MCC3376702.1 N-acetyltransferase [Cohnella sp. REN36]
MSESKASEPAREVEVQKQGNGYMLRDRTGQVGEISYRMADADTWIIDHIFLDPRYRGTGMAKELLDIVVEEARDKGRKIIPSCAYALALFKRRAEYADVWRKEEPSRYSDAYSSHGVK